MTTETAATTTTEAATTTAAETAAAAAAAAAATTAAETAAAAATTAAETAAAPVIPAEYADFTVAEGKTADPTILTDTKALAKDLGLTQEAAQKLFDKRGALTDAFVEAQKAQIANVHTAWQNEAKADKDIGGTNFEANVGAAKAALNHFGSPALNTFLAESGIGNHPEMIRLGHALSKLVSNDTIVPGGRQPTERKSFYDHPTSQKPA